MAREGGEGGGGIAVHVRRGAPGARPREQGLGLGAGAGGGGGEQSGGSLLPEVESTGGDTAPD